MELILYLLMRRFEFGLNRGLGFRGLGFRGLALGFRVQGLWVWGVGGGEVVLVYVFGAQKRAQSPTIESTWTHWVMVCNLGLRLKHGLGFRGLKNNEGFRV